MNKYLVVVTKSTVPVGTARRVRAVIQEELDKRGVHIEFDVASNPEFLKEGAAIKDFMSPDRVVVGVESEKAQELMSKLYRPFLLNNFRVIFTDIPSAEMIKYAANSMLATRISFMNDIANLCELVGADVNMVRKGIGSDSRIGNKFLYPGCGYGGSCFPKDVKALIKTAEKNGYSMKVLKAVEEVNENQKSNAAKLLGLFKNQPVDFGGGHARLDVRRHMVKHGDVDLAAFADAHDLFGRFEDASGRDKVPLMGVFGDPGVVWRACGLAFAASAPAWRLAVSFLIHVFLRSLWAVRGRGAQQKEIPHKKRAKHTPPGPHCRIRAEEAVFKLTYQGIVI